MKGGPRYLAYVCFSIYFDVQFSQKFFAEVEEDFSVVVHEINSVVEAGADLAVVAVGCYPCFLPWTFDRRPPIFPFFEIPDFWRFLKSFVCLDVTLKQSRFMTCLFGV